MDADFDLDSLSQQLQVRDVIALTILDGDLAPGQTVELSIFSKRKTRYHLYLFFQHQMQGFDLVEVEGGDYAGKVDLTVDHMDVISFEKAYLSTYDEGMCWSNHLVSWKTLTSDSKSS